MRSTNWAIVVWYSTLQIPDLCRPRTEDKGYLCSCIFAFKDQSNVEHVAANFWNLTFYDVLGAVYFDYDTMGKFRMHTKREKIPI